MNDAPVLMVASETGQRLNDRLADLPSVDIIDVPADAPWAAILQADILWASPLRGWRNRQKPAGWPGRLRWAQIASTGIDAFPEWFFEGLPVACTRGNNAAPIAEYVMLAILSVAKSWDDVRVTAMEEWRPNRILRQIQGDTIVILGLGAIGSAVAQRALAFGMNVIGVRRTDRPPPAGVRLETDLSSALAQADQLVVALPATGETHKMIGRDAFRSLKRGAHLINVARGAIVNHDDLLEALDEGILSAATLDVTDPEPLPAGHPLYTHPKVRLTPHISWSNRQHAEGLAARFIANLERYRAREPLADLVVPQRGY